MTVEKGNASTDEKLQTESCDKGRENNTPETECGANANPGRPELRKSHNGIKRHLE